MKVEKATAWFITVWTVLLLACLAWWGLTGWAIYKLVTYFTGS